MMSSKAQAWNTKHILLNNLENKHSLAMKFVQIVYVILQKKIFY